MKTIIRKYLLFALLGVAFACKKDADTTPVPTVAFVFSPASPTTQTEVSFTATTVNATTFAWSSSPVGFSSTVQNPKYTFTTAGTYVITLVATGAGGNTTVTKSVIVGTPKPSTAFTFAPISPKARETVTFIATAPNATTFAWSSIPISMISTLQNPTWIFPTAGSYQVTLKATGAGGDSIVTKTVVVSPPKPSANFTFAPTSPTTKQAVVFTATVQDATTFAWSSVPVGFTSTLQNPTFSFPTAGTYQVSLKATGTGGDSTITKSVVVAASLVKAAFTFAPANPIIGQAIILTGTSTAAQTFEWSSTPTGFTSTLQSPTVTFTTANTYKIKLAVVDAFGNRDSTTRDIVVTTLPVVVVPLPSSLSDTATIRLSGTLQAIKAKAEIRGGINVTTTTDIGTVLFYNAPNSFASLLDAGTVKVNTQTLTKNPSNAYTAVSLFGGFALTGNTVWSVAGNGSVPAIEFGTNKNIPAIPQVVAFPNSIDKAAGFTIVIPATAVVAAGTPVTPDVLFITVSGLDASGKAINMFTKSFPVNSTSLVITAAEVAALDTTKGFFISVNAVNYVFKDFGGKVFLFSNIGTNNLTVVIN